MRVLVTLVRGVGVGCASANVSQRSSNGELSDGCVFVAVDLIKFAPPAFACNTHSSESVHATDTYTHTHIIKIQITRSHLVKCVGLRANVFCVHQQNGRICIICGDTWNCIMLLYVHVCWTQSFCHPSSFQCSCTHQTRSLCCVSCCHRVPSLVEEQFRTNPRTNPAIEYYVSKCKMGRSNMRKCAGARASPHEQFHTLYTLAESRGG